MKIVLLDRLFDKFLELGSFGFDFVGEDFHQPVALQFGQVQFDN